MGKRGIVEMYNSPQSGVELWAWIKKYWQVKKK